MEMDKLDEGLGFALIIPIFFLLIPISISSIILYIILRDKKMSILGSIIGLPFAFWIAYSIAVSNGEGIIWHLVRIDVIAMSPFAPYIMAILFGMLTAFMGLIFIKTTGHVFKITKRNSEN
jgi:hypothetical protein